MAKTQNTEPLMDKRTFDSSSLKDFLRCPRLFYFTYRRGWRTDRPRVDLIHGTATHAGLGVLYSGGTIAEAVNAYEQAYFEEWGGEGPTVEELNEAYPKAPSRMPEVFDLYMQRYGGWMKDITVLGIEKAFSIQLGKCRVIGRLDLVYEDRGEIWVLDHKTTKRFASNWDEQWSPDLQMECYSYAARQIWGDKFSGMMIDGILFQQRNAEEFQKYSKTPAVAGWFRRIPLSLQPLAIDAWKDEVSETINNVRLQDGFLDGSHWQSAQLLRPFGRRTTSCHHYYGCSFRSLCGACVNPEKWQQPPQGFVQEFWAPFDLEVLDRADSIRLER